MTKKHFVRLAEKINVRRAEALKGANASGNAYKAIEALTGDICDLCQSVNGRFDRQRFLTACGF